MSWVKIDRAIQNSWIWETPLNKTQAWLYLIMKANYRDRDIVIGGRHILVKRGQLARSEITLAEDWGWSRGKVRRFLRDLKTAHMIEQYAVQVTSVITVCNYEKYQGDQEDGGTADSTAVGTQCGTIVGTQEKKGKKVKNIFIPPTVTEVREFMLGTGFKFPSEAESFVDHHAAGGWVLKNGKQVKDWQAAARTWMRNHKKYNPELYKGGGFANAR